MQFSARNVLQGWVGHVAPGAVNGEVTLVLGDGVEVVAVLTVESIKRLGLTVGMPAFALIKSTFITVAKGTGVQTSARNHYEGTVAKRIDGAVNSEIRIDIGQGRELVAMVTIESAQALGLNAGVAVTALVKAQHVILGVEDEPST
jgi:molybdate transport system regulatory protein